jgi:hypothetical protein
VLLLLALQPLLAQLLPVLLLHLMLLPPQLRLVSADVRGPQ